MKSKKLVIILCVAIVCVVGFFFAKNNLPKYFYLVEIYTGGGMCSYGPCHSIKIIYKLGHSDLVKSVNAVDFSEVRSHKFVGMCPTSYDGLSVTYSFYTEHGKEVINDCEFSIKASRYRSLFEYLTKYSENL